jgi:hypothetical protein
VEISNRFAALENMDESVDIDSVWEVLEKLLTLQQKKIQGFTG